MKDMYLKTDHIGWGCEDERESRRKNDFLGKLYYNFSVLICLPQSMEYPNSQATGAARTPSTLEDM
jgi:hypothetical protein